LTTGQGPSQFWDTSALIGLILKESRTADSLKARDEGKQLLAWEGEEFPSLGNISGCFV
jgi:hypothetical protein